jgi:putative effector of murein hydrolase LrgA (UPF0299 family)
MENRELKKAATIVGMLLLLVTFVMGILDTLWLNDHDAITMTYSIRFQ